VFALFDEFVQPFTTLLNSTMIDCASPLEILLDLCYSEVTKLTITK